jgi:hypothetical protein
MPKDNPAIARIHKLHQEAFAGGAWHGPALLALVRDILVDHAAAKPITHAHSIWEIVLHINAWQEAVLTRLNGRPVDLNGDEDWPPVIDNSESAWEAAIAALESGHRQLAERISALTDGELEQKVPGRDHTVYKTVHGLIQHNLYHAGQIAILKKSER